MKPDSGPVARQVLRGARDFLLAKDDRSAPVKWIRGAVLIAAIAVGLWSIRFSRDTLVSIYPIEFREGASQLTTQLLLDGRNPFSAQNQPLGTNAYGFLYSLLVLPLASVFGNTLMVHRAVSLFFILLSSLLVFWFARRASADYLVGLLCALFTAVALMGRAGLGATPNALGTFLFLASILVPYYRGFDAAGLWFSALLGIAAFYTKPYFVLGFAVVICYVFLSVSVRRALTHALMVSILFLVIAFLVKATLPFYFSDTVAMNFPRPGSNMAAEHMLGQLRQLGTDFSVTIFVACVAALVGLALPGGPSRSRLGSASTALISHWGRPLFRVPINYLAYSSICCFLAFVLVLGRNRGNYMTYAWQLIVPTFFLWLSSEFRSHRRFHVLLLPLLAFNLVTFTQAVLPPRLLVREASRSTNWQILYHLLEGSDRIYNTPPLVSEMVRLGIEPVDSGHTQYYFSIPDVGGVGLIGPPYQVVRAAGERYRESIRSSVARTEFDLLVVTPRADYFYYDAELQRLINLGYHLKATITLDMPQAMQQWEIEVWEPNEP